MTTSLSEQLTEQAHRIGLMLCDAPMESIDLHMGEAGVVLFQAELFRVTGDPRFLHDSRE